jgi:hypothetical protein
MNLLVEASIPLYPQSLLSAHVLSRSLPVSRPGADVLSVLAAEAASKGYCFGRVIGEHLRAETAIPTRNHAFVR